MPRKAMPRKAKQLPFCYMILCYYPPPDWRTRIGVRQIDPARLTPEVLRIIAGAVGKMPQIGVLKPGVAAR